MEEKINLSELESELNNIDIDSIKLDAIIQLKTWQKKMYSLIDKTYKNRLNEIDFITKNLTNQIKETQNQIENLQTDDENLIDQIKTDIDFLKSNIKITESIPENFEYRIERTIRVLHDELNEDEEFIEEVEEEDDDDEPVLIEIDQLETRNRNEIIRVVPIPQQSPVQTHDEGRISKILNSQPVQNAIATGLVKTIAQMGTIAATSTTTVAATTMAKTALIATACGVGTVAYGVGRIALGTTRKVWALIVSSDE